MIKIWWINHHAVPPIVPGITRHYCLAMEMQKLGYMITIINSSYDHLTPHFEEGKEFGGNINEPILRKYDGVQFCTIPTPSYKGSASLGRLRNMWAFYVGVIKYLSKTNVLDRPDVIIGSTVHPLAAYAGYKLSKKYQVPFIYEVRDLWPMTLVKLGKLSRANPLVILFGVIDKIMVKKSTLVITSAPQMQKYYIEKFDIPENKFLWITNGTSLIQKTPLRMRTIEPDGVIKVGYTGSIGFANGIREFLMELTKIPQEVLKRFRFSFVGDGPLKHELSKFSREKGLPVDFKDAVSKNEIWTELMTFDILLFTLVESSVFKYGISPNKLADYHAAARPIIEIVSAEESPVALSRGGYHAANFSCLESILSRITNESQEDFMIKCENARNYALDNYSWQKLAGKLDVSLRKII